MVGIIKVLLAVVDPRLIERVRMCSGWWCLITNVF